MAGDFESFFSKPTGFQMRQGEGPNYPSSPGGIDVGVIDKLYTERALRYRADIRLISGDVLIKVRLPGPWYVKLGYFTGMKIPFRKGQMCLIGYRGNRADSPFVIYTAPFPTSQMAGGPEDDANYDPEEFALGHESGHKIILKDKLLLFKYLVNEAIKIDYQTKKITFKDFEIEFQGSSPADKVTIKDGKIEASGNIESDMNIKADQEVEANSSATKTTLSQHQHPTAVPGPPSPPTPGT